MDRPATVYTCPAHRAGFVIHAKCVTVDRRKADMPPPKLTPELINAAIDGFESQKRRIDDQIAELRALLSGSPTKTAASPEAPARRRRKFSANALRRMREAQQRRWAKVRGEAAPTVAMPKAPKPKRKLSAAAKAKLVANLKKARAAKAGKAESVKAKKAPARKKHAAKKAAVKAAPAKAAKATATKKTAATPSPAEVATE